MIDRRLLLLGAAAAMTVPTDLLAAPSRTIPLWPGQPPGGGGPSGPEERDQKGAVRNVATPSLRVFPAQQPNGAAVLIAAGGGYTRIENGPEAEPAAQWLSARGITAFVLTYRLPGEGWASGPLAPLQDAQRALRLIRAGAGGQIDPQRLGVLGFSAGGHLLGLAATRSAFHSYEPVDEADRQSARPDDAALIYPVITLEPPYEHTSTRKQMVGPHPDPQASADWSVQTHVRSGCPPMFLVQAEDDPISDPHNTLIMADACREAGIPVDLHRVASGGHGFGMGRPGTPTTEWPSWYEAWLRRQKMMA